MLHVISLALNRLSGGKRGQTLCARVALVFGAECLFCKVIAAATEPGHCAAALERWLNTKKDSL